MHNDSQGIEALKHDAVQAAQAGDIARTATEQVLGRSVVNSANFLGRPKKEKHTGLLLPKPSSGKKPKEPDEPTQETLF